MRYLVVSDLHSNWEALEAVLADSAGLYDHIVCCGDLVGYGPDPNRVVEWARARLFAVIRGNHDRACTGNENLEWFNPVARAASLWTLSQLNKVNFDYLNALPAGPLAIDNFQLIHGSPLDEDEYLMSLSDAHNVFDYLDTGISFFGHTHLQGGYAWFEGGIHTLPKPSASQTEVWRRLEPGGVWLINAGSVGQPRDGDPRASYALFDSVSLELLQRRVFYDSTATRLKIAMHGLPDVLGSRLVIGR